MSKQALRMTGSTNLIVRDKPVQSSLEGVPPEAMVPATVADRTPSVDYPISNPKPAEMAVAPVPEKKVQQMTSVRLDEDLYIRLCDAGRPRPGQPKRKQNEIMVEALEEWLNKRGL